MTNDIKVFVSVIVATLLLVFGLAFVFGRGNKPATQPSSQPVASDILVRPYSHKIGTDSARVTVVEFSDFQCPSCKAAEPVIKSVLAKYDNSVRFVYRHFPLPAHEFAFGAAEAAEAAGLQGKFWEMKAELFTLSPDLSKDKIRELAQSLNLDVDKFNKDLDSDPVRQKVLNDQNDGNTLGVNATPTFYVNGTELVGVSDLDSEISSKLK